MESRQHDRSLGTALPHPETIPRQDDRTGRIVSSSSLEHASRWMADEQNEIDHIVVRTCN